MNQDFTISLAQLHELPAVREAYRRHRAAVNAKQRAIVDEMVKDAIRHLLDAISTLEIPLATEKNTMVVFQRHTDETDSDLVIASSIDHRDAEYHSLLSCLLDEDRLDGMPRSDFDDQASITHAVFQGVVNQLKGAVAEQFPEGNVKVALKREKIIKIQLAPVGDEEPKVNNVIFPRHLLITVALPASVQDHGSRVRSGKRAGSRGSKKALKKDAARRR